MSSLEKVKEVLEKTNSSLVIFKDNKINTYSNNGIKDLIVLLSTDKKALDGAIVADKVIGKVAGSIMIKAGVKEAYAEVISELVIPIFKENNIKIEYNEKIPFIQNRDKNGMCPMESKFKDESDMNAIWKEYIR